MKMGGLRVLILVDTSTSMLGRTYVNVVRFLHMDDAKKRRAPKWMQAVNTVDWLTTQIKPGTRFQIYGFNETAASVVDGTDGDWLEVTDGSELTRAVDALREIAPDKGTSLINAFKAIKDLDPFARQYLSVDRRGCPHSTSRRPPRLSGSRWSGAWIFSARP